jgi:hypothetical protein
MLAYGSGRERRPKETAIVVAGSVAGSPSGAPEAMPTPTSW